MVKRVTVKYYRASDGSVPVRDFIRGITDSQGFDGIGFVIELVKERCTTSTPHLPLPHARHIVDSIWELRAREGRNRYRILYAMSESMVILLHAFRKGGQKTPEPDKRIAQSRFADFKFRMNAEPRLGPSPIAPRSPP